MNPLLVTSEIHSFLNSFPTKSRRRGNHIHMDGAVFEVSCVEAERKFKAVVRSGEEYQVSFEYNAGLRRWSADCTCPEMTYCKHAFAGMLALQNNAPKLSAPAPAPGAKSGRVKK